MSQTGVPSPLPSSGRATPRWSSAGHPALLPASMAGLTAGRAIVSVPPPLFWRGPRDGLALTRSPAAARPQVLPLSRLLPADVTGVLQLPPGALSATIVFFRVTVPLARNTPPPEPAALPAIVTLVRVAVAVDTKRPPPWVAAALPLR